jgi:hypothetical protein
MIYAKKMNDTIIFQANEESGLVSYDELIDYVAEGCEVLAGMIMCNDGVAMANEEDIELLVRFS